MTLEPKHPALETGRIFKKVTVLSLKSDPLQLSRNRFFVCRGLKEEDTEW